MTAVVDPQVAPVPLDPTQVVLGLNNGPGLYIAPVGTAPPADNIAAWATPWASLGYLSDDGVTVTAKTESNDITPWQSASPIRHVITGKSLAMHFTLWQTNSQTLALYFDCPVPSVLLGVVNFDLRSDTGGVLYALGLDIKDGANCTRLIFPRAQISDNGDVSVKRGEAVGWECTLTALDNAGILGHVISGSPTGTRSADGRDGEPQSDAGARSGAAGSDAAKVA